jgi:hypothetical protein
MTTGPKGLSSVHITQAPDLVVRGLLFLRSKDREIGVTRRLVSHGAPS